MQRSSTRRVLHVVFTAITAVVLFFVSGLPAWAAESMTLTFVRHGQSQANAADRIDTSVPGPELTQLGEEQAEKVAIILIDRDFDGIYASNMVRTQLTAMPLAGLLNQDVQILPGLREISAGIFEGSSESGGLGRLGYGLAPVAWTLGARFVPVLGAADGNAFDARVDHAIQAIYDNGDRNAVAFSHGATIMFWVMMNVDNPDLSLMLSHPLGNTGIVVVTGNPEDGWLLTEWDGVAVSANPPLLTKLFVDVRDLVTAPQTALYNVVEAFTSGDINALANAVRDGVIDVVRAVVEFVPNVVRDIADEFSRFSAPPVHEPVTINAARNDTSAEPTDATVKPDPTPETTAEAEESREAGATPLLTKIKKRAGATDLTNGNKVRPGETTEFTDADADAGADLEPEAEPGDLKGLVTALTDRFNRAVAPDPSETDSEDTPTDTDSTDNADAGSERAAA
ncbi:histidine phosphatase family protein [Mycolicibacterium elephantis]|uniref:Phosphoglycerate mutase n=1 Tax=Mycolicibacterium elephantis DSM 44368 TaxID=1335622 RepID=A0A439DQW3_9MYCO|nr:histidine phosphatase family protein [Mycolicibacterium elephantis]RWA18230.1 hypothetical protein MELE44368_23440 [Mycolicibacterium elephantis DSM 44368]